MKARFTVSIAALAWSASVDQVVSVPAEGEDRAGEPTRAELLGFLESGIVIPVPVEPETTSTDGAPSTAAGPAPAGAAENASTGPAPEAGARRRRARS